MLSGLKVPVQQGAGETDKNRMYGGWRNRTLVKDGQSYSMYQSCWAYGTRMSRSQQTREPVRPTPTTCLYPGVTPVCLLLRRRCLSHEYATYSCESKTSGKVMVCGETSSVSMANAIRLRAGRVMICRSRFSAGGTGSSR